MAKHLTALVVAVFVLAGTLASAHAEKRVALVIGNSTYQHTVQLKNPQQRRERHGGKAQAAWLRGDRRLPTSQRPRWRAHRSLRPTSSPAPMSDSSSMPGHGLQVDGKNFLAPIDASLKSDADIDFEAVELDLVLSRWSETPGCRLVFLDACRDNPLAANLAQSRSLQVGRGLAADREGRRHDDRLRNPARQCRARRQRPQQPLHPRPPRPHRPGRDDASTT